MFDKNPEEQLIKEGEPNKPTYYIIRRLNEDTEISAMYRIVMGHVWYALSKGWLPVVDMQNYPNPYLAPEKLGKENAWEYYFEQPFRVKVEQAYDGENVILSNGDAVKPYPDYSMNLAQKKNDELVEWRMLIKMGLMTINPKLAEEIPALKEKLFSTEDNVLGVILRGGDYSDKKIKGRPIPPPIDFAINSITTRFNDWACTKILLRTEDKSVAEMFKNIFGDKCTLLDQIFSADYDTSDADNYFLRGKEHLAQMILLSQCNSLIAEKCGDTTSALLPANKFEHTYFFNLGTY